jgi:hypothetical protein
MRAERALVIVPGSLVAKTTAAFATLAQSWAKPRPYRVISKESLQVESGAQYLDHYQPDLIVIDESDTLSNYRAAAPARIDRHLIGRPHVRVVAMTGTPARKSIMGYWHILWWCLRLTAGGAPMPESHDEASMWALALDDHKGRRPAFGPLGTTLDNAREWYRRRLVETPGVVIVDEDSCDAPLTIRLRIAREDPMLDQVYERFLVEMENPAGMPVSDPFSRWRLDGQLGLGLYSRWNPPPPDAWYEARRNVARFVRNQVENSRYSHRPLDTEAQVLNRYPSAPVVTHWREIKPTFEGVTETVWLSRSGIDSCLDWLRATELDGRIGIIWSGSVAFGRALAREADLEYYGSGDGARLLHAPTTRSLVASYSANMRGFDMQPWTRQLIAMPPQSGKLLEQIFGRSHRRGQDSAVIVDVLVTSGGTLDLVEAALSESTKVRDVDSLTQKIMRADIVRATPNRTERNKFRWARKV